MSLPQPIPSSFPSFQAFLHFSSKTSLFSFFSIYLLSPYVPHIFSLGSLISIKHLLYVRHYTKSFTNIILFNLHNSLLCKYHHHQLDKKMKTTRECIVHTGHVTVLVGIELGTRLSWFQSLSTELSIISSFLPFPLQYPPNPHSIFFFLFAFI
jgi:hypothetical protein